MIATEHQYRTTSRKLTKLRSSLEALRHTESDDGVFGKARLLSLTETVAELEDELREYAALKAGAVSEIAVESLADLPKALIKGRVARGFSQSDLASELGVRPQQVQRWEAEEYASAAFTTLARIADALRLDIRHRVPLDDRPSPDPRELRRALVDAGLPRAVVDRRIMPRQSRVKRPDTFIDEVDARLRKLFGMGVREAMSIGEFGATALQFRLPANAAQSKTRAYAGYLDGVCKIVAKTVERVSAVIPDTIEDMHARLFADGISLSAAIEACWELGIGIIALDDSIGFNGACSRRSGRDVVVLRIRGKEEARALFDLIHELYHLIATSGDFVVIEEEETSINQRESVEERRADRFAAEVLTDGRLEELLQLIVSESAGSAANLKSATESVAKSSGIPVGIMANLFAGSIDQESNRNWWAVAHSLQQDDEKPWKIVRDAFVRNASLQRLDRIERDLLDQILETADE
jgi:transcriptional regulator with XRE-family HTH domain/Zn-dependent peptidase ImmA (M78 family)